MCSVDPFQYYIRLKRLRRYIEANISRPVSAVEAAQEVGVSANYFSTWFHERAGEGYTSWVRRLRLAHARQLMARNNLAIVDVAARAGFGSVRAFERAFKNEQGCTPSSWKARHVADRE